MAPATPGSTARLPARSSIIPLLVFDYYANETFAGSIGGSGAVTTIGNHVLTLTGTNTYSGLTTVSAGTLQLGTGAGRL